MPMSMCVRHLLLRGVSRELVALSGARRLLPSLRQRDAPAPGAASPDAEPLFVIARIETAHRERCDAFEAYDAEREQHRAA